MSVLVLIFGLVVSCNFAFAQAKDMKRMQKQAQTRAALVDLRENLACKYSLLSVDELESRLMDTMGQADKDFAESDYGSRQAVARAEEIFSMANELVKKTSTDNRLALEGFLFAGEIRTPYKTTN